MNTVIAVLLLLAAVLAAAGYVRSAYDDSGGREQMPSLLVAFILALGFIGLIAK